MTDLFGNPPPMRRSAILSDDGVYRYVLTRTWDDDKPSMIVIGLNPSTADGQRDDNTIRRCVAFARREGRGQLLMLNLFAFRATNPADMIRAVAPIGEQNDEFLRGMTEGHDLVVAAWGTLGWHMGRDRQVAELVGDLKCFGRTVDGSPRHPLYLPRGARLEPWEPAS